MRNLIFIILCLGTVFASCDKKKPDASRVIVAKIMDSFLYVDDIDEFIPEGLNAEDSLHLLSEFIRQWAIDILMYEKAKENIADSTEIVKLVNEYRKSLILSQYQHGLIERRYAQKNDEEELNEYYERFKSNFLLKESVVKGILLVVPIDAPDMKSLARWIEKGDKESIESIEKYSLRNAISYDYFVDNWITLPVVLKTTPYTIKEVESKMEQKGVLTATDDLHKYFLRITDVKKTGEIEPYELVREKIINILATQQKSAIITDIKNKMYKEAEEKGEIIIY